MGELRTVLRRRFLPFMAFAAMVCTGPANPAAASNVRSMNPRDLADLASQVIVGRVTEVRSYWAGNPRRIESEIRLEAVEYLKGRLAASPSDFRLVVPGGTVGEMQMRIADAPEFVVGQRWVLFLLPSYKTFPVVGLNQGAFRIATDAAGIERVHRADGRQVQSICADSIRTGVGIESGAPRSRMLQSDRVRVQDRPENTQASSSAISLDEFRVQLAPILRASRDHKLTKPAGEPQQPSYAPTSLRPAGAVSRSPQKPSRPPVRGGLAPEAFSHPARDARGVAPRAMP